MTKRDADFAWPPPPVMMPQVASGIIPMSQGHEMMSTPEGIQVPPPQGAEQWGVPRQGRDLSTNWPPDRGNNAKKKKRSRWGGDNSEKTFIPGMPTIIPAGLPKEKEQQYLIHLQIEEISRRLRTGDLGIPANPEERSPSPEPIYNNEGKRLNTREYRTRKKLEEERHNLVQRAMEQGGDYKPPADYKPPVIRVHDKVMIPQEEHPDINFVGLLIGPRGNTLKNLEKETGAKIIIRGKGSVKEGKIGRKDGQPLPGEDEPLHAYVTANNPENVRKAVDKIKDIIKQGIEVPEGQNDLRRQQLRELALLNGTLRENDGLNKLKQIQQAQTIITNQILCTLCGGAGHIAQDCKQKRPGDTFRAIQAGQTPVDKAKMDSEYMSLMAELGEGPPPPENKPPHHHVPRHFSNHPPNVQVNQGAPWQQPPPQHPPQQKPPGLINLNMPPSGQHQPPPGLPAPPMGSQPQPMTAPPHAVASQPPQLGPPPVSSSVAPPWQHNVPPAVSVAPPVSSVGTNIGVPPPSLLAAAPPPPPPPSSQTAVSSALPWQTQASMPNTISAPPPPALPPWQTSTSGVAPVPPPPPAPNSLPPWQQAPPPPAPVQPPSSMAAPMAPPPPPPTGHSFNPAAPPPPPPGGDYGNIGTSMGLQLGVPPPPPPN